MRAYRAPVAQPFDRELHASLSAIPPRARVLATCEGKPFPIWPGIGWRIGLTSGRFKCRNPQVPQTHGAVVALVAPEREVPAVSVRATVSDESPAPGGQRKPAPVSCGVFFVIRLRRRWPGPIACWDCSVTMRRTLLDGLGGS